MSGQPLEAWMLSTEPLTDMVLENRRKPNVPVSTEELLALGIQYQKWDATVKHQMPTEIDKMLENMRLPARDEFTVSLQQFSGDKKAFGEKMCRYSEEHFHAASAVRIIKEGSGYFDVRNWNDEWIRIHYSSGDVFVLPGGLNHRFSPDEKFFAVLAPNLDPVDWIWKDDAAEKEEVTALWVQRPPEKFPTHAARVAYLKQFLESTKTILGPVNAESNFVLDFPELFDTTMKSLMKEKLRNEEKDVLMIYFTGVVNPVSGKSWCEDCDEAKPYIEIAVENAQAAMKAQKRRVVFLQCNVARGHYKNNASYLYRMHPFIQLSSIPTLMVLRAKAASKEDDELGVEVVATQTSNFDDSWVQKL